MHQHDSSLGLEILRKSTIQYLSTLICSTFKTFILKDRLVNQDTTCKAAITILVGN